MWLSKRGQEAVREEHAAELGRVTLSGDPAAVMLTNERRGVAVFGPGGYCWRPMPGQSVLVLKTGQEGEQPCVAGAAQQESTQPLAPGEVFICAGSEGGIYLSNGGAIHLRGRIYLNGELVSVPEKVEEE